MICAATEQRALEKKVPEPSRQTEVHRFVWYDTRLPLRWAVRFGASCAAKEPVEQPQNGTNGSKLSNTARLTIAPQDFLIRNSFGDWSKERASGYVVRETPVQATLTAKCGKVACFETADSLKRAIKSS
jgi:hypothetical protein